MDVRQYWADVRKMRTQLEAEYASGSLHVCSLQSANTSFGHITAVSVDVAAKLLTDGTHRAATDEEIAAERTAAEARQRHADAVEVRRIPSSFRVNFRR